MVFIQDKIKGLVSGAVEKSFHAQEVDIKVEYPGDKSHGDYSTSAAFELGKKLKKNPREVAAKICSEISKEKWIEKIETAGNGFINFYLSPSFLTDFLQEVIKNEKDFGSSNAYKGKTIVTDTSHPNIAKPMGVHHLLSTIIGNALNRIFASVGYNLIRDNYIGDWGTQYGKLMWAYKKWGDEAAVKANPIPELLKLYVRFHDEAEKDASLEEEGRKEFKKLEDGDGESRKLWKWIVDLSIQEFYKIWNRLDVSFDVIHGESFYEDKMQEIIDMGIDRKIFVEGERGALIAPFDHDKYPPCIIRKSDGATLYATRDLARTKYWEDQWHPDLMVIVADTAQTMHFQQFFEVAGKLGITDANNIHVWFGRMRFPEKRMSTRKGNIILLEELLDEAEERAYAIVQEKNPELSEEKKREVARQVGIGAVKYSVLAQNRTTDVTFTWEKMLSLEGNSAPYLQYVYARACSILRKQKGEELPKSEVLSEHQEIALARLMPRLPEVVLNAATEFKPNLIANYLFEVASAFNTFYSALPVLAAEPSQRASRLALVKATTVILKNGLHLLGIEAPEEM